MAKEFLSLIFVVTLVSHCEAFCEDSGDNLELDCTSCAGGYLCQNKEIQFSVTCDTGEACVDGGTSCAPYAELNVDDCGCTEDSGIFQGSYADPYNSTFYVNCTTSPPTYAQCLSDEIFSSADQACVQLPSCSGLLEGSYPIPENCNMYYTCSPDFEHPEPPAVIENCDTGLVFDFESQECITEPLCIDGVGESIVDFKCNLFKSCYGNTNDSLPIIHCCPQKQIYDNDIMACVDGTGSCTRRNINDCLEEDYENTYCNYCQALLEGDKYPTFLQNIVECSAYYYQCELVDGQLTAVLKECGDGYIFSADSLLCETVLANPQCA